MEAASRNVNVMAAVGAVLFSLAACLVFSLPDHPDALRPASFARLPLEWPAIGLLVMMSRGWLRRLGILACGLVVFSCLFLKLADIGVQAAFQRQFNPYLDMKMLADGWNLMSGTVGIPAAAGALTGGFLLILLVLWVFLAALGWMSGARGRLRSFLVGGFLMILAAGGALVALTDAPVAFATPAYLAERLGLVLHSVAEMRAFETELADGPGPQDGAGLFQAVKGKDIVLVFVESYGHSAVEDPQYAQFTMPRLAAVATQLESAGLHAATAWVTSPTVGGLSWLAHATLLSGLWIDSQARYDRLMISRQPSLNRLFSQAGWQSVAVMPAITKPWPEADYFGYDQVLSAATLEYRGKAFNWVTMPDQYTLSAFEKLVLRPAQAQGRKVMAEMALISSHAPWTPVPSLVDWDKVADGRIFDEQATSGDPPAIVWARPERVRHHYIRTIDYSLATLGQFMVRQGRGRVFIILGDHQPASIITGPDASRAVPLHIVTDDGRLASRFFDAGFTRGMTPNQATREWPMNELKQLLIAAFGDSVPAPAR